MYFIILRFNQHFNKCTATNNNFHKKMNNNNNKATSKILIEIVNLLN